VTVEIVQNHITAVLHITPSSDNYMVQYNVCVYSRLNILCYALEAAGFKQKLMSTYRLGQRSADDNYISETVLSESDCLRNFCEIKYCFGVKRKLNKISNIYKYIPLSRKLNKTSNIYKHIYIYTIVEEIK